MAAQAAPRAAPQAEAQTAVLIVEDEPDLAITIESLLRTAGYQTSTASSVMQAESTLAKQSPGLILLDWMLPGMNGLDWVRQLRRKQQKAAIVLLTARASDDDKEQALAEEIDDYIAKPFSNRELLARIAAVLRRRGGGKQNNQDKDKSSFGELSIDSATHSASYKGRALELNRTEFALLQYFINNPNTVHSRDSLLQKVWGDDCNSTTRTVDVHILWLRKKLAKINSQVSINTVWGVGYQLVHNQ